MEDQIDQINGEVRRTAGKEEQMSVSVCVCLKQRKRQKVERQGSRRQNKRRE